MARSRVRTVLWRFLPGAGLERCQLVRDGEAWLLTGTILTAPGGVPAEARYAVRCDAHWRTRSAEVRLQHGGPERVLELAVEGGRWLAAGEEIAAVRGSIDVDLNWSPSTNTLPIRRLGLAVGAESGPVTAAWVRFPDLEVHPLPQAYRRLAEDRYRYTSRGGEFTAELTVDDLGLVVDYGEIWQRVGVGS